MTPSDDHARAESERRARALLLATGAEHLPRAPWLHPSQPPAAADLVRFALWRDQRGEAGDDDIRAALALLTAARAELDQLEAGALFTARAHGLSWAAVARALGLGSAQAALQRFTRVSGRTGGEA